MHEPDPESPHSFLRRARLLAGLVLALLCCVSSANAQRPDPLPPVLRWGGDVSGGEPYIIENKDGEPTGFEGELARYLGKKLGRPTRYVNGSWDQLPKVLERGDVDVVLNGYEWSAEREKVMASTVPYYFYRLRLIVHKDSKIRGWDDLKEGMEVGVLKDSAADRYLQKHFPKVKIIGLGEEGTTTIMSRVAERLMDATVQDDPVVSWYLNRRRQFPALKVVGDAVPSGKNSYYVMYVRPEDTALRARLDQAIRDGLQDGSLRDIFVRYGLWADEEGELTQAGKSWPPSGEEVPEEGTKDDSLGVARFASDLGQAALYTLVLTFTAMPLAMAIGLLVALGRLYGPNWLAGLLTVYVEVIRGTPFLFQLIVIFFFLPKIGLALPAFWAGVLGLAINYGASEAENYRAGLLAIPEGQTEAALALGMSRTTALRRVVVPQAVRLVIPPVTNDFIALFKDTSICSAIGVTELLSRYRTLTVNFPQQAVYTLLITASLYLLMSYPLSLLARYLEAKRHEEEDEAA